MRGAIRGDLHGLDIAAGLDSYHLTEVHDAQARGARVMLLPGSGGRASNPSGALRQRLR
jgi:hypothetical protein